MKPHMTRLLVMLGFFVPFMAWTGTNTNLVSYIAYTNLWNHADLVIIGRATFSRRTGGLREMKDHHHAVMCEEVETSFHVELILKGTNRNEEVTLQHFRVPEGQTGFCLFGPKLAKFAVPPEPTWGDGFLPTGPNIPAYLLFLKRTNDGHIVPVSGQEEADWSVREVYGLMNRKEPEVQEVPQQQPPL